MSSDLEALGADFWSWRARTQPTSGDDIPRIGRPPDWTPDWSPRAIGEQRAALDAFSGRWETLSSASGQWPVAAQVDCRLIGSAIARVHWELNVLQGWRRNPQFYVLQTLGPIFEALLQPPPFDRARQEALLRRAGAIPATLEAARTNLAEEAIAPFATLAIGSLADIDVRLASVISALTPLLEPRLAERLSRAVGLASEQLASFGAWLEARRQTMAAGTAIGRDAYVWFLRHVALMPWSPEAIAAAGRREFERAAAFEALERQRNHGLPPLDLPRSLDEQLAREASGEAMLRTFCVEHELLRFPSWLRRYRNAPLPAYLAPLRGLGVTDDLTSPTRLDQDGIHYIPEPAADLPYFYLAMARDPRTLIAHEGMHYYQLAQSWAHPDALRRFFYDSGPNEGIGFYAEEMLLQSGLFEDSPRSREIIYSFMRLRAVRVGIDVGLALGELSIESAAQELARRVPMDAATAYEEASFFASSPGQAITYQIGKLQILAFLSDARQVRGESFSLLGFHDALWLNGNVPIALQRWEALGLADEMVDLDT